jgi:ADP-ribosylglycohydrolase
MITPRERYRGALLGLAAGDAVGTTVEFSPPGTFPPATDMVGGGPFRLHAGEWTDDTSMALCLAESLIERRGFDAEDQMRRYVRWRSHGHLSSNGRCFDIGNTVAAALRRFEATGDPWAGSTDPHSAGNGSIMRLAPVPLLYAADAAQAIALSGDSSLTTHGAAACVDACRYLGGLLVGALRGEAKETLLAPLYHPVPGATWADLDPTIAAVAGGSFARKSPPAIKGSGYVVESLEAALWAFYHGQTFEEGCLLAVNLGHDADTTAAVYGQLAGAYYGVAAIPAHWRDQLAHHDLLIAFADQLHDLAQ